MRFRGSLWSPWLLLLDRDTDSGPQNSHLMNGRGPNVLISEVEKKFEVLGPFFLDSLAAHPEVGVPTEGTEKGLT